MKDSKHNSVHSKAILSKTEMIGYGTGYLGIALVTQVVVTWAIYFYAPPIDSGRIAYIPIALAGIAMGIGRVIDSIADPVIGILSDNTKTKWGRRIPFIMFGSLPLVIAFILIWTPPVDSISTVNLIYLTIMLSLFFFFFTVVVCPYLALLPQMAKASKDRVTISSWQALFNIIGLGIAMVVAAILIENYGFKVMGFVLGIIALLSFYMPVLTVRERSEKMVEAGLGFKDAFLKTLNNTPFLYYVISQLFFWFGFNIIMTGTPYIVTLLMGLTEGQVGLVLAVAMLVALLCFPLIQYMVKIRGKKMALIFTLILSCIIFALLGSIGKWPLPISPSIQGIILVGLAGIPLAGLFILPNAIVADICDYDEKQTGKRREAVYYGMQGLILKGSIGLSSLALGFILEYFGYSPQNHLGVVLLGPVAAVSVLIGLVVFIKYPDLEKVDRG